MLFYIVLAFSKYGKIKLGRDGEEPEYSTMTWIAMLFSAGMNYVFGIPNTMSVSIIFIAIVTFVFTMTVVSGLKRIKVRINRIFNFPASLWFKKRREHFIDYNSLSATLKHAKG